MPIYVLAILFYQKTYQKLSSVLIYYIIMKVLDHFCLKPSKPKMSKVRLILTQWIIFKSIEKSQVIISTVN